MRGRGTGVRVTLEDKWWKADWDRGQRVGEADRGKYVEVSLVRRVGGLDCWSRCLCQGRAVPPPSRL